ncbi:MAG: signal recognition particle subunit SRP19/SEC65 family protein [Candidatus Poseidoniales archaeon]
MIENRPKIVYPEYFDSNLKRSQGRKVPLNQSVKNPTVDEIYSIIVDSVISCRKSQKSHSGSWPSSKGSLEVSHEKSKVSLLHQIGKGLKSLRKTD